MLLTSNIRCGLVTRREGDPRREPEEGRKGRQEAAMTHFTRGFLCTVTGIAAALLLSSCAGTQKASRSHANAMRPVPVEHSGTLTPVSGIARTITGKTVVLVQPWVGRTKYELRENPIYFRADGYADSIDWVDIPWSVQGGELCMVGNGTNHCYSAYQDDARQAYVMHRTTGLLAKVQSIEPGDPHHLRAAYEARQQQLAAQQAMMAAFAGMLFEAMLSGGGGGGSQYEHPVDRAQQENLERMRERSGQYRP